MIVYKSKDNGNSIFLFSHFTSENDIFLNKSFTFIKLCYYYKHESIKFQRTNLSRVYTVTEQKLFIKMKIILFYFERHSFKIFVPYFLTKPNKLLSRAPFDEKISHPFENTELIFTHKTSSFFFSRNSI